MAEPEVNDTYEEDFIVEIAASARDLIVNCVPADEAVGLIVGSYEAMGLFPQAEAGTRIRFEVRRRLSMPD
jgi:hypothetical protein